MSEAAAGQALSRLKQTVREVRTAWRMTLVGEGASLLFFTVTGFLIACFILDNLFHLSAGLRVLLLVITVAGALTLTAIKLVPVLARPLTKERVAIHIESRFPELENCLINSLQLSAEAVPGKSAFVDDVVCRAAEKVAWLDPRAAISGKTLKRYALGAAAVVALLAMYTVIAPRHFQNAWRRVLLPGSHIPPLTLTSVQVEPGDASVLSGQALVVTARMTGRLPRGARIAYLPEGGEWKLDDMPWAKETDSAKAAVAKYEFPQVIRPFSYYVSAGDARSPRYEVELRERPKVLSLRAELDYPAYLGLKPGTEDPSDGHIRAPVGANVKLLARSNMALREARLVWPDSTAIEMKLVQDNKAAEASFGVSRDTGYRIELVDSEGIGNQPPQEYRLDSVPDEEPVVQIPEPGENSQVRPDEVVALKIQAKDDHGIAKSALIYRTEGAGEEKIAASWEESTPRQSITRTKDWSLESLALRPGTRVTYYAVALDGCTVGEAQKGKSPEYTLTVIGRAEEQKAAGTRRRSTLEKLTEILGKQRAVRSRCLQLASQAMDSSKLQEPVSEQAAVRKLTVEVIEGLTPGEARTREALHGLATDEMVEAGRLLERAASAVPAQTQGTLLRQATDTQAEIIRKLGEILRHLMGEERKGAIQDLRAQLQALLKKEKEVRTATVGVPAEGGPQKDLAARQNSVADNVAGFVRELRTTEAGPPEASEASRKVADGLEDKKVELDMRDASGALAGGDLTTAMASEGKAVASLESLLEEFERKLTDEARDHLAQLKATVAKEKENLAKLVGIQGEISALTEELAKRPDASEREEAKMGKMAEMHKQMAAVIEQLAEDLSLLPETPVSNHLNDKMREIYEDVVKAAEAKDLKPSEMAVIREDSLLEALKKQQERVEDLEMWLPDKPDSVKWNMESFDTAEIPKIPLTEIPDELEDMVGELIEKQEDQNKSNQDATSNWTISDGEMGWDAMDGPISSYAAKGKSGNTLPNQNEMGGRSGAGRSGKASGEVVESFAKDLPGAATPPRRTSDPFQKGHVAEENPMSATGATGGGKQSGSGEEGLSGRAPIRDEMALREMARRQAHIRRNAEQLGTAAELLFLPAAGINDAVELMRKAEDNIRSGNIRELLDTQRLIVHALENAKRDATGKPYIQVEPELRLPAKLRQELLSASREDYPKEFSELVSAYYKTLSQCAE